jgi:hypothetical protein
MHGMIFSALRNYVEQKYGDGTWDALLVQAALKGRVYLFSREYPDAEATALVSAASAKTDQTAAAVLEGFGEFLVPTLLKLHGHMLQPQWKTLDVIEHTEGTMHRVVRVENQGAHPPQLNTKRINPSEVLLIYNSPRRMCALAIGIGRGLAKQFHEEILITQPLCVHNGADHCEILFRKASATKGHSLGPNVHANRP